MILRSGGRSPYESATGRTPSKQEELIARFRRLGGNVRDLERIAQHFEEDARTTPQAMRQLGRNVARQHKHSELFDDPVAGWSKEWELR